MNRTVEVASLWYIDINGRHQTADVGESIDVHPDDLARFDKYNVLQGQTEGSTTRGFVVPDSFFTELSPPQQDPQRWTQARRKAGRSDEWRTDAGSVGMQLRTAARRRRRPQPVRRQLPRYPRPAPRTLRRLGTMGNPVSQTCCAATQSDESQTCCAATVFGSDDGDVTGAATTSAGTSAVGKRESCCGAGGSGRVGDTFDRSRSNDLLGLALDVPRVSTSLPRPDSGQQTAIEQGICLPLGHQIAGEVHP